MKLIMAYLDGEIARLGETARALTADHRQDEGNLAKIRANVCGICKSLLTTLGREKGEGAAVGLQTTWSAALDKAKAHEDSKKAAVEMVKLEQLAAILEKLRED